VHVPCKLTLLVFPICDSIQPPTPALFKRGSEKLLRSFVFSLSDAGVFDIYMKVNVA
jgi:hypothetical protein